MTQDWIRLDDRRLWIYGAFFLSAVVLTLYSVSLGHAFLFDEENIILKNPYLKDPGRWKELWSQGFFYMPDRPTVLWTQYFRPLTSLSFALNFLVSKADPFLYHVTNAFLHGVVCVLLFRWVWRVTGHGLASLLAALFFAVHPVQTEAVSYLASRSDLLAAFAVLTTFHLYRGKKYLAGVVVFAMGLFMKESVILLPVALFLFDGLLLKADTQTRAKRLVPFFVVAATYLVYRKYFCAVPLGPPVLDWREAALRVMSMGDALEGYARAIVWPKPFQFGKEIHFAQNLSNPIVWKSAFLALALAALAVALRKTKGPLLGLVARGAPDEDIFQALAASEAPGSGAGKQDHAA